MERSSGTRVRLIVRQLKLARLMIHRGSLRSHANNYRRIRGLPDKARHTFSSSFRGALIGSTRPAWNSTVGDGWIVLDVLRGNSIGGVSSSIVSKDKLAK